jgi:SAM-dependent methyltransferase
MAVPPATVRVAVEWQGDAGQAFEILFAELETALGRHGLDLEPGRNGRILEDGFEVGTIVAWQPGERALLQWRPADWEPEESTELELRVEGSTVVVEHRGFGRHFWAEQEVVGWFSDQLVAPLLAASAPSRLGDWLTDRAARRPSGQLARESYRDPTHHRPSFGAILKALDLRPDDVLLEIGCGGGAFLEQALRRGCRAKAVDHSREMVRVASELNADAIAQGRLEIVQASAEQLPFADDSCTCAAMMQVFFFLAPGPVLAECRRVVRAGGRLAVFTVSERAKGTPAAPEPMASRGRFYTDEQLVELAHAADFRYASVQHPDLERHARAAGLPDDVVALFAADPGANQLLLAK